ncbi:unnamed protein product [Paramecium primaurelia]|uniref:Leucine-rich repeat protein n=1 Tax=Paramecium primaurelia TaxID=5886 RepID=A0A8S1P046_PARPR|nr:unnamed protein product [Paramecium primaurelia]
MNKDSRYAYTKSSMSPNKNLRQSEQSAQTYSTGFTKKNTFKATQQNQTALISQLPEIQKKRNKNEAFVHSQEFQEIIQIEQDERYRYLIKNGTIKKIENGGNIIFSELQQIPGIWVCYRRPQERQANAEKLSLDWLDLSHMPLLEGEEKLKILTFQHNRIGTIQNLVSLPNLLYLDLYDNQIKEIEELKQVQKLKVLLLPKNQIRKIQNLDYLQKLEVLDLHSNKITNLEGLNKLKNLKVLNLGNNLIQKLEGLEELTSLNELNLKINQIEFIDHIQVLPQLQKLFLSQNKINQYPFILDLLELSLENNPITQNKSEYYKYICSNYEKLRILDGKSVELIKQDIQYLEIPKSEPIKKKNLNQMVQQQQQKKPQKLYQFGLEIQGVGQDSKLKDDINPIQLSKKDVNSSKNQTKDVQLSHKNSMSSNGIEDEIISLIKKQWIQESKRIQELEQQNQLNSKSCLEHQILEGGHAEVEDDTFLLIYGTAAGMVLPTQNFNQIIEKIHFQYMFFDSLIDSQLQVIKEYTKLKEIILKDNYINSLLQLAKLEHLIDLQKITIQNNQINNCSFMFSFLVYRIPTLIQINNKDVRNEDRQKAKLLFSNFDKALIMHEKGQNSDNFRQLKSYQKNRQYIKTYQKALNEVVFQQKIVINQKKLFDNMFENYLNQIIEVCNNKEK